MNEDFFPEVSSAAGKRAPVLTPKRREIIGYLRTNGTISLAEAAQLVGGDIYHNQRKHTGALLAGMIEAGLIVRVKRSTYQLAP